MRIRQFAPSDLPRVLAIWNACVDAGETAYKRLTDKYFAQKFLEGPGHDPRYALVAEEDGRAVGFLHGAVKTTYLPGETNENTPGYVTILLVAPEARRRGIGAALLSALEAAFRAAGKTSIALSSNNPVNLDWTVPGTPGHDHNNAPGADEESEGYGFFLREGFEPVAREIAMYLDLADYRWTDEIERTRARLRCEGIETGRYDASLGYDFDGMCDRVGSEYWRSVLRTEIACWQAGTPCDDARFWPDGRRPKAPRPILAATCGGNIVGFTGPVDLQASGRGWFTGICTDPLYGQRGIAGVLFNLLMREFVAEGARFSTLFTGVENHAQRLYLKTGFRVVRRFAILKKPL